MPYSKCPLNAYLSFIMHDDIMDWGDFVPRLQNHYNLNRVTDQEVWEWSLVLSSRNIEHVVELKDYRWHIHVRQRDLQKAQEEIDLYVRENAAPDNEDTETAPIGSLEPTIWFMLILGVFYRFTGADVQGFGYDPIPWKELGYVDVWAVSKGEWWRLVTGLTLHADIAHLLGNMVIGGVFISLLCRKYGSGYGWVFVLGSGILGNYLNTLMQDYTHNSLGFSTAVFGAIGLLGGSRSLERRLTLDKQQMVPFAAGLGLLAMLGSGGGNTDFGAHVSGFLIGFLMGCAVGWYTKTNILPTLKGNRIMGLLALGTVIWAWYMALQHGLLPGTYL
ncbi:MAG: rhomboid family protein [Thermodesulfobacteriota bacterium]